MEFKTKIESENISCYGVPKYLNLSDKIEISDITATAIVKWRTDIDAREWGIKEIVSIIHTIDVEVDIEYYEHDDIECEKLLYKSFQIDSSTFDIKDEMEIKDGFLSPSDIVIDFAKKTITVS